MGEILEEKDRSLAYYGLLIILSLLALFNGGINHNVIYWTFFIAIIIVGYYIYNDNFKLDLSFNSPILWYSMFCLWSGGSIIWSITPHWTILEFLKLMLYGFLFMLATKVSNKEINKLGNMIVLLSVGLVSLGILKYLFVTSGRMESTFYNPNPFGLYIGMVFLFQTGLQLRTSKKKVSIKGVILLIGLFLSGSRGAIIACSLALPLIFLGLEKGKIYKSIIKISIIIVIALMLVQLIVVSAPYLQQTSNSKKLANILIRSEGFISSSIGGRLVFWEKALDLFKDKPLRGYGLGSYHRAANLKYMGGVWYARFVHNHYLQMLSELGFIGGGLFLAFIFSIIKIVIKQIRRKENFEYIIGVIAASLAFTLHIGIDFTWNFSAASGLFFVGLGIINSSEYKKTNNTCCQNKNLSLLILVLLLFIGIFPFVSNKLSTKGYKLLLKGNINKANNYYKLSAKVYPINPETHYFISQNYLNLFNSTINKYFLTQALVEAKEAVELSPINSMYHNNLGKIYWKLSKSEKAEKHLTLGVEYGSYLLERYLDLGYYYYKRGRSNKAVLILEDGIKLKEEALIAAEKSYKKTRRKEMIETLVNINSLLARLYKREDRIEEFKNRVEEIKKLKKM